MNNLFKRSSKGIAAIWLQVLFGIAVFGIAYVLMSFVVFGNITPALYPSLNAINETESSVNKTALYQSINLFTIIWEMLPFIFIFGLLLYGFVASQRKGYEVSYG